MLRGAGPAAKNTSAAKVTWRRRLVSVELTRIERAASRVRFGGAEGDQPDSATIATVNPEHTATVSGWADDWLTPELLAAHLAGRGWSEPTEVGAS